jgi:hypothetical protein
VGESGERRHGRPELVRQHREVRRAVSHSVGHPFAPLTFAPRPGYCCDR